jgi:hypothetical protein
MAHDPLGDLEQVRLLLLSSTGIETPPTLTEDHFQVNKKDSKFRVRKGARNANSNPSYRPSGPGA